MGTLMTTESVAREKAGGVNPGEEAARRVQEIHQDTENQKVKAQGGRTDEEIVCQTSLSLTFGKVAMEVPIIPFRPAKPWRAAYTKWQGKCIDFSAKNKGKTATEAAEEMTAKDAETMAEIHLEDKVDLVVLYLEMAGVGDDSILDKGTNAQFGAAFEKIQAVASPLSEARTQ